MTLKEQARYIATLAHGPRPTHGFGQADDAWDYMCGCYERVLMVAVLNTLTHAQKMCVTTTSSLVVYDRLKKLRRRLERKLEIEER